MAAQLRHCSFSALTSWAERSGGSATGSMMVPITPSVRISTGFRSCCA